MDSPGAAHAAITIFSDELLQISPRNGNCFFEYSSFYHDCLPFWSLLYYLAAKNSSGKHPQRHHPKI